LFVPLTIRITGGSLLIAIELDGIVRTTTNRSTGCLLYCLDLYIDTGGRVLSSVSSVIVGPLPLEALVKRVELISIYTTIAFIDKGERCLVFVKGLTQFKCILNSTINQLVLLIRLLGYYSRLSLAGVSELYII
jgi:hypothetical protein